MVIFFSPFWAAVLWEFAVAGRVDALALLLPTQGAGAFGGAGGGRGLLEGALGLGREALDVPPGALVT